MHAFYLEQVYVITYKKMSVKGLAYTDIFGLFLSIVIRGILSK